MEKKTLLGVQKKRPIKRNKKKFLKKVIDYLISEAYMFAPLISSMKTRTSITGSVEVKKPITANNKKLLNKVGDYLKSDSYMYGPLLAPPPSTSSPPKGSSQYCERVVTMAVSKRKLILKDSKSNLIAEDQASKRCHPEKIISEQQSVVHKETVKHMVHPSCRSSLLSGKGALGSQLRKLVD